jgi:hypothetical protein
MNVIRFPLKSYDLSKTGYLADREKATRDCYVITGYVVYANYVLGFLQIVFCDLARETI